MKYFKIYLLLIAVLWFSACTSTLSVEQSTSVQSTLLNEAYRHYKSGDLEQSLASHKVFLDEWRPSAEYVYQPVSRGDILSQDGVLLATSQNRYSVSAPVCLLAEEHRAFFIDLFNLYSGVEVSELKKKLIDKPCTSNIHLRTLYYEADDISMQKFEILSKELASYGLFKERVNADKTVVYGLGYSGTPSLLRKYPQKKAFTPLLGYTRNNGNGNGYRYGLKGVEKQFDEGLNRHENYRLTISHAFQCSMEALVDEAKEEYDAKEVLIGVMRADEGKMLSLATSNRYDPGAIKKEDYLSLNANVVEYSFESGSLLKPIVFAMLLEQKKVTPYDLVDGHNGRFKMGGKVITDKYAYDWLSADNVIVHSSNIGIAQLAQKFDAVDYYQGLLDAGFGQSSGVNLPYEDKGSIPSISQLDTEIYKATTAYGYGLRANLMQLLKVYNTFNNNGRMVTPVMTDELMDESGKEKSIEMSEAQQLFSLATAQSMKKILIKTVDYGTGYKAFTPGLEIGGKTGTAHIAKNGVYVEKYNSSFFGFANDGNKKYTIGVLLIEPKKNFLASTSAVPVFKSVVDAMIRQEMLLPDSAASDEKSVAMEKTISPIKAGEVITPFGIYVDPVFEININNTSIVLKPPVPNARVYNVLDGYVQYVKKSSNLETMVIVRHKGGMQTIYYGLLTCIPELKKGLFLKKGRVIGRVNGPLEFEVYKDNRFLDPLGLIEL